MAIDKEDVEKVFHLSRITPSKGDIDTFASQLDKVLDYMAKLEQVDTAGVTPVGNITDLSNVLREDDPGDSIPRQEALQNAPSGDGEFFRVPGVFST